MRIRVDDRVYELAEPDPTLERRAVTAMARHETWQIWPAGGVPVTVGWGNVTLFQVLAD